MFANYLNDTLDPQQEYNLARFTIDRDDFRKYKPATLGIEAESREFSEFRSKSDSYRNTLYAEGLLSKDFSVSQDQLTNTLSKGGMNKSEINVVIEYLKNHKNVDIFYNKFNGETTYRKKV